MSLISDLSTANAKRWSEAKLTRRAEYVSGKYAPIPRILAAQNRYELIQAQTGVHWTFVACTHYRESNLDFSTQLAQGDPLSKPSRNVPKGRGPFETFEQGAYDALVRCDPKAALNTIWKRAEIMPDMLTLLEMYNGLGYARKGVPSPYLWAGTDQYTSGKYVRDHVYDPNAVDKQLGVAGILVCLQEKYPTLFKQSGKPVEAPKPPVATQPAPTPVNEPTKPTGPILNKEGEDIADLLAEWGHNIWEWLRRH